MTIETWLVTGAAGFIGSHTVAELLHRGQRVRGLDDLSTGSEENLRAACSDRGDIELIRGDIRDRAVCQRACAGVDRVVHLAAVASVPRSMEDPLTTLEINDGGFINVLEASRRAGVKSVVYASSSAVYGAAERMPIDEADVGAPLSPYALSKQLNEHVAAHYADIFRLPCVGMRYFNVYGGRQDPNGAYAAVIPRWLTAIARGGRPVIYGDGTTTRDFCYVGDVAAANVAAALRAEAGGAFNIACGRSVSLDELFKTMKAAVGASAELEPIYEPFRAGDILHSSASIARAERELGFRASVSLEEGLRITAESYLAVR